MDINMKMLLSAKLYINNGPEFVNSLYYMNNGLELLYRYINLAPFVNRLYIF
jgi:hypothetical protein